MNHYRINSELDRRFLSTYLVQRQRNINLLLAEAVLVFLGVLILGSSLLQASKTPHQTSPKTLKPINIVKVEEVQAKEERHCTDRIDYIRCAAEDAGLTEKDASTLIRIARAEAGCGIKTTAKNPDSTASGAFQIIYGTWNSNYCKGSAFDFFDNTNCAVKIYKSRGTQPWETSAHQASGNGWSDPNQCESYFKS